MGKKKALGMDPLTWLKSKNKEEDLNTDISNQREPVKKPLRGSVINLSSPKQKAREARTYESGNVTGKLREIVFGGKRSAHKTKPYAKGKSIGGMIFNGISNETKPIEKPFKTKVMNTSDTDTDEKMEDVRAYEPSDVTEKYRSEILGEKDSGHKSRFSAKAAKENPATIFVVVYTILLLLLGFLVYKDLTGKIDKLEAKLTNLEKRFEEEAEF